MVMTSTLEDNLTSSGLQARLLVLLLDDACFGVRPFLGTTAGRHPTAKNKTVRSFIQPALVTSLQGFRGLSKVQDTQSAQHTKHDGTALFQEQ